MSIVPIHQNHSATLNKKFPFSVLNFPRIIFNTKLRKKVTSTDKIVSLCDFALNRTKQIARSESTSTIRDYGWDR